MLHPGLYEQVINNALESELSEIPEARKSTAPIDTAEASKVLAQYLTEVVQKGLDNVQDNGNYQKCIFSYRRTRKSRTGRHQRCRKIDAVKNHHRRNEGR